MIQLGFAYCDHVFHNGSLIKISDGQNINYLEKFDMTNLYNLLEHLFVDEKIKLIIMMNKLKTFKKI